MSTSIPEPQEKWRRKGHLGEWTILSTNETTSTLDNCAGGVEVPLIEMTKTWERVEPFRACEPCPNGCVFACRAVMLPGPCYCGSCFAGPPLTSSDPAHRERPTG